MAKTLTFETGLVDYDFNGVYTARFNPTDETFISKLEGAFDSLDGIQETVKDSPFEKFAELDRDMRVTIDGLLGDGAADALFPNMNCYAIADGLPVWMNLVLALMDEVSEACEREFGKTDGRMKAHSKKYDAMLAKYGKGKK